MTVGLLTLLRRHVAAVTTALALAAAMAACTTTVNPFPPPGSTPQPALGATTAETVASVIRAFDNAGLQAEVSAKAFRPFEGPLLDGAPRTVIEVDLPDDPSSGFVVVYALATSDAALAAASDHAAYLAAGIGGLVQYPPGTRFTVRVVGSNVIFFSWLPATSPDSRTSTIEDTLRSLGTAVEVPS